MERQALISSEEQIPLDSLIAQNPRIIYIDLVDPQQKENRYRSLIAGLQEKRQIVMNIELTSACNLRCKFCLMHGYDLAEDSDQPKKRKPKAIKTMSLQAFQDIIKKCEGLPAMKVLYLAGHGEPLLHPQLATMVKSASEAGIAERIIIITNGVLLVPQLICSLAESGLNEIRVSLDLFSPVNYQKVKGKDYALTVRRNIKDCLELIHREELPVGLSIECMNWLSPDPELQLETYKIIEYFGDLVALVPGAFIRVRNEIEWFNPATCGEGSQQVRTVPCEQLFFQLVVHADGDVSPCCHDTSKNFTLGNIFAVDSLREIMESPILDNFRKKMLRQDYEGIELCRTCNFISSVDQLLLERRQEVFKAMQDSRSNNPMN